MWPLLWASTREQRGTRGAGPLSPAQRWRSREPHKSHVRPLTFWPPLFRLNISSVIRFWFRLQMPKVIHKEITSNNIIRHTPSPLFTAPGPAFTPHAKDRHLGSVLFTLKDQNRWGSQKLAWHIHSLDAVICQSVGLHYLCLDGGSRTLTLQTYVILLASFWFDM